jgi:hypothetical protein
MRRTLPHALAAICALGATLAHSQERKMGVTQAPETVFSEPIGTLLPELEGATATGENGRVGSELVFWGYRLGDGRPVFLFACAQREGVNCEERVPMICVERTNVLHTGSAAGHVVHRVCSPVALARPGEARPGCVDTSETVPLAIGLVSCG